MRKKIWRSLAGILAVIIAFTSGNGIVFAENHSMYAPSATIQLEGTEDEASGEEEPEGEEDSKDGESEEESLNRQSEPETEKIVVNGSVEVRVIAGIEVQSERKLFVALSGSPSYSAELILPARTGGETEAPEASVRFADVPEGEYDLTVAGEGYLPYTQHIQVSRLGCRVQIYTGKAAEAGGRAKPGVIVYGDVNGDGRLDEADSTAIVDAVDAGGKDGVCDLNGDGVVDLLDLNYFTDLQTQKGQMSTLEKLVPAEAVGTALHEDTYLTDGSSTVEEILKGEGTVMLAASGDGEISELNSVGIGFDLEIAKDPVKIAGIVIQSPTGSENGIKDGKVAILYEEDGTEKQAEIKLSDTAGVRAVSALPGNLQSSVSQDGNGNWIIDLGGQVAVKKVTLTITGTRQSTKLAEISRVEFVNDMASRIPDPVMNIPTELEAVPGNKSFELTWKAQTNVTGYEISISKDGWTEERRTTGNSVSVSQFHGAELKNGEAYTVSVQSTNGEWRSGFSTEIQVVPKADKAPSAPDHITVKGGCRSITVRWGASKDADSYRLFWREAGASDWQRVEDIQGLYYQIRGLKDNTKYEAYLTAVNEIGESGASLTGADRTQSGLVEAKMPAYKLINTSNGNGELSSHIKAATIGGGGTMKDSPLDKEDGSAFGLFDNNYTSYVERIDWDYGGAYPDSVKGVTAELDKVYSIGAIVFVEPVDLGSYSFFTVQYWDEEGAKHKAAGASIHQRSDGKRSYYVIKFKEPVETSKVQLGVGRYNPNLRQVTISEIRFYEYDSLEQDIQKLYTDDLHIVLRDDVNEQTLQELQNRLDAKDPVSGEYHPERAALQKELDVAKELLATGNLSGVVQVNPNIAAAKDSGIAVGGLNSWQPLGVAAAAEEELVVYVGKQGAAEGANATLQLVFTQQHADSSSLSATKALKVGRNEITVPKLTSLEQEKGGGLYVQYTGNNSNDRYAVRVSGGTPYPVLNLYQVSGAERSERIRTYVQELRDYQGQIKAFHEEHQESGKESVAYAYDERNCILNMTDIQTDQMMFSLPATQIWAGLGGSQEETLKNSLQAMDAMLKLFYQHKGLTDSFAAGTEGGVIAKNHLPYQYLNIRYMRMFSGAFMYASGNHIGIEWNEARGMMGSVPVSSTPQGKYQSGRYFGWGIAHEIGHEINQGAYAHAEVTNNYFSVLAQAKDSNDSVRFQYSEVFRKVTSNTLGYSNNVFTQLGLYWQLHLAYDRDYNYKTYGTYQEIFENLFFARVDSYAREPERAPAPGGVQLALSGERDQNLMRLASAAAEKDLTDFFQRWGMSPNRETSAYMGQFEPERRAIYYVDDAARVYEMEQGSVPVVSGKNAVTAKISADGSEVKLTMMPSVDPNKLQGYEIVRVWVEEGREKKEIAGFTQTNSFTDHAAFASNRVLRYEVVAVDKCMNRSNAFRTEAVKIAGDGLQDKTAWTVSTNMISNEDKKPDGEDGDPCEKDVISTAGRVVDNDAGTTFTGSAAEDPYLILELNRSTEVTALGYRFSGKGKAIGEYKIEISTDGKAYREVKSGVFQLKNGSETVYFENGEDPWVCTYDARYVKVTAVGQAGAEISITELDLYGPSGDNVEFREGAASIGRLAEDYFYGSKAADKIPKGSIVFTGTFKGNPAYNVVVLYDEKGEIVGGTDAQGSLRADQVILAPDPGDAMLGETSEGTWIYWIEAKEGSVSLSLPRQVRAELYRVDNALTNEGQRMVSDTKLIQVPDALPSISLKQ